MKAKHIAPFIVAMVLWLGAVYLIASPSFTKYADGISKDAVEKTGPLGDTFGIISSLMTAFAAIGAILALSEQRTATRRQVFIATFVGMMDRLQQTVQDTDYSVIERTSREGDLIDERLVGVQSGQNAFFEIAQELRLLIDDEESDGFSDAAYEGLILILYDKFYRNYKDALGHYFRQVYHILRYVDDSLEEDKERFAKLLRASFTNSQMLLLSYNAVSGEGRIKFAQLIKKYSMLHNLGFENDRLGKMERRLIETRIGKEALESKSQREDLENPAFKAIEQKNLKAKEAYRERLMGMGASTDVGVPWISW